MSCFFALAMKNDGKLKLRMFRCMKAWDCIDTFNNSMFREETTRMTSMGLMTSPNPAGVDLYLAWMRENCRHPQRSRMIEHVRTLKPMGVVISPDVLRAIDKATERLERRRG